MWATVRVTRRVAITYPEGLPEVLLKGWSCVEDYCEGSRVRVLGCRVWGSVQGLTFTGLWSTIL